MNTKDKKQLIEKLDIVQHATGILGCDLAFLLDITKCYITNMRRRAYVSDNLITKIELLIKMLSARQQTQEKPIFRKPGSESISAFKIRRQKMMEEFKNCFLSKLAAQNDKD